MVIDTEKTELENPFIDIEMGVSRVILNYRVAPRIIVCNYLEKPLWYAIISKNHYCMQLQSSPDLPGPDLPCPSIYRA